MNKVVKIIEYGLYLLVFLLPFQTRWIIKQSYVQGWPYEFSTLSIYAVDVLLIILIAAFSYYKIYSLKEQKQKKANIPLVWWLIGLIEFAAFISIWFAPNKIVAGQAYLRLLLGIGLFWLVSSNLYDKIKLLSIILFSSVLQALLGIGEFFTQATFASTILGMAKHLSSDISAAVITTADGVRWLRAYGSFDHPNIFGSVMAISLLLAIIAIVKGRQNNKINKLFLLFVALALAAGLFFSFSRAAWLSFAIGFLIFFVRGIIEKNKENKRAVFKISIIIALLLIMLSASYFNFVNVRLGNSTITEKKSISERIVAYNFYWQSIKTNWILGLGIGNYGLANQKRFPNQEYYFYEPFPNVYWLVFAEIGILGLVGFMALLLYFFINIKKAGEYDKLIILFSILIIFLFDHWWWSLHIGVLYFWLILGLLKIKE
ncbi:MAG: O-antigen ligase family protein [Candidatus Falkowbacteria bacterium]|nr:O-antigen ligase family protein [Candidatus Falkowbacteria bacterium]